MNELLDLFESYVKEFENAGTVLFIRKGGTFVFFEISNEYRVKLYSVTEGMCMGYTMAKQQDGLLYVEDYEKDINGHTIYIIEFRED